MKDDLSQRRFCIHHFKVFLNDCCKGRLNPCVVIASAGIVFRPHFVFIAAIILILRLLATEVLLSQNRLLKFCARTRGSPVDRYLGPEAPEFGPNYHCS